MRGKRRRLLALPALRRFIPAHAGKTRRTHSRTLPSQVHPRACGENRGVDPGQGRFPGSSPRMRGKLPQTGPSPGGHGFIPAHAGKTRRDRGPRRPHPVHPRACGENRGFLVDLDGQGGSSPRMRGKPPGSSRAGSPCGFIPAHAGKTSRPSMCRCTRRVHPRACGENEQVTAQKVTGAGSSPRMRGKPASARRYSRRSRFIPAHAGKTQTAGTTRMARGVHPRACGENIENTQAVVFGDGSSPRMRGKRAWYVLSVWGWGFIPAHAGKTRRRPGRACRGPVHPRACGENPC